jgi:hypothetical protein
MSFKLVCHHKHGYSATGHAATTSRPVLGVKSAFEPDADAKGVTIGDRMTMTFSSGR